MACESPGEFTFGDIIHDKDHSMEFMVLGTVDQACTVWLKLGYGLSPIRVPLHGGTLVGITITPCGSYRKRGQVVQFGSTVGWHIHT